MRTPFPAVTAETTDNEDPTSWRVDDARWGWLEPLRNVDKPRKNSGHPRRADPTIVDGLIWPARTATQGAPSPHQFGPTSTVHARLREWVASDARARAWTIRLQEDDDALGRDWSWQAAAWCSGNAPFGKKGTQTRRGSRGALAPIATNPAPHDIC